MVFGRKNIFGIEADFFQGKEHLFISYCLWVDNIQIGDNTQTSLLTSELGNIEHNVKMMNSRNTKELKQYNYKDIYAYLNFELWGIGSPSNKIKSAENISSLKVIKDYGECFDGYFCYLLGFETYDLIIWSNLENKINHSKIPKNMFYRAFQELNRWIKLNTKLVLIDNNTDLSK